ncbi:MAG TPA: FHA domain-containing protein [Rhodanobacteraceae bacterium]|nr:FHA domain-containing protein [Rhodanobacteraceae bacterium]
MRLEFPQSRQPALGIEEGATVLGAASDCDRVLVGAGVAPHHCRLERRGPAIRLMVLDAGFATVVNGRQVEAEVPLEAGDVLLLGSIGCVVSARVVPTTVRTHAALPPQAVVRAMPADATQIRSVLPKLVLRGTSGPTLGRGYPVRDGMVFGRSRSSDVFIESQEISRSHATLRVSGHSIRIEDLGSTNGTFVNGKQVVNALIQPGDEIALDNVRFMLIEPGAATVDDPSPAVASWRRSWWLLLAVPVVAAVIAGWLWLGA